MGMADDDRTSALQLAQVLSTDQALTAKLIRISNSAFYGFARRVSTVREAILVLGFKQVRQLAVGTALMNLFAPRRPGEVFDLDLFWGHSVAVAVAAETVARKTRRAKPEDAFTAGILHDIGRLAIRQLMPEEFDRAVELAITGDCSLHAAECTMTGYSHEDVGRALGEKWKFPPHLIDAVCDHHNPRLKIEEDGLAGIIAQCNRWVLHYGLFCGYDIPCGQPGPLPLELMVIEEACRGIDTVLERAFAFIESASGTPARWYSAAG